MGEGLRAAYEALGRAIERLGEFLQNFDPTSWTAWVQVVSGVIGILWVLYQFARTRRLSEAEVEDWIEEHLDDKPRNLMNERAAYLAHLNTVVDASFSARGLAAVRARMKMFALFFLRVVLIRGRKPSAAHAMLLFDAGRAAKAEGEFNAIAADFERMVTIYEKQVRAKRLEACNAYLYAGRAASELKDTEATKRAYEDVLRLNHGDADAYKLIGKQYLDAGNIPAALSEYGKILTHAEKVGDRAMEAEAYRLQAAAHLKDNRTGRAQRMLARSRQTEPPANYRGLAETQKMLGDLFVRQGNTTAAVTAYTNSTTNYGHAGDKAGAAQAQAILDGMGGRQPWLAGVVEGLAQFILRLAKRLRDRGQKT